VVNHSDTHVNTSVYTVHFLPVDSHQFEASQ
jgi:hypothetical protein